MDKGKIGIMAVILGVSVWPIGLFALRRKLVPNILTSYLCFVISGVYLRGYKLLKFM